MPEDKVTCPKCGRTFSVGVPRGKRIESYGKDTGWQNYIIHFACPNCNTKMGARLENFKCRKDFN